MCGERRVEDGGSIAFINLNVKTLSFTLKVQTLSGRLDQGNVHSGFG